MSEGPIKREREATTTTPIPRIRAKDHVRTAHTDLWPDGTVWTVLETDGAIALLQSGQRRIKRFCRDLTKVGS